MLVHICVFSWWVLYSSCIFGGAVVRFAFDDMYFCEGAHDDHVHCTRQCFFAAYLPVGPPFPSLTESASWLKSCSRMDLEISAFQPQQCQTRHATLSSHRRCRHRLRACAIRFSAGQELPLMKVQDGMVSMLIISAMGDQPHLI